MNRRDCLILLVEDDQYDRLLLQRAFRKAGISNPLQFITDGEAAVQYLAGDDPYADRDRYPLPTIVLLDLKLPRKSGFEVLQWLRQQPELRHLLVVVLTSSKENTDINRAYQLGANSYLVKPPTFDGLQDLIEVFDKYWMNFNERPEIQTITD